MRTVKRSDIAPWKMVAGNEDVYHTVITADGRRNEWTAVGWIDTGMATDEDKELLPLVVEDE